MKSRCISPGTWQNFQSQSTYLRKSLRIFFRNASSFVPKKVLIVSKLTRYHFEKLREPGLDEQHFKARLLQKGSDYEPMLADHVAVKEVENEVVKVLKKMNIEYKNVDRSTINRSNVMWADLVLPIGGDGTFLLAANLIFDNKTPILGINSNPKQSEGFLMLSPYYTKNVPEIFELLKTGSYDILMRSRIRTTLKGEGIWKPPFHMHEKQHLMKVERFFSEGQLQPTNPDELQQRRLPWLALNEAFVAELLAAKTSTLLIKLDDEENFNKVKSSGLCISTGTGSTSWYKAINSINPKVIRQVLSKMNNDKNISDVEIDRMCSDFNVRLIVRPEEPKLCYALRDMVETNVWRVPKSLQRYNSCKKLTVKSLCYDGALVLDGGIGIQFNLGTTAEFEIDPKGALRHIVLPR